MVAEVAVAVEVPGGHLKPRREMPETLLVGGCRTEKYEFVNGKDYSIYEMENKSHVP